MMRPIPFPIIPTIRVTHENRIIYTLISLILPLAGAHRILHFRKQLGRLI